MADTAIYVYRGEVIFALNTSLFEASQVEDKIIEVGEVEGRQPFSVTFRVEAADGWDLRDILAYLQNEVEAVSNDITLGIDKACVEIVA